MDGFSERYKDMRALSEKGNVTLVKEIISGNLYVRKTLGAANEKTYKKLLNVRHKNLEQIKELYVSGSTLTVISDYFKGSSLADKLSDGEVYSYKELKKIVLQLCDAVECLYKHKIVHRDINPNNILIDEKINLKLIDYSISRIHTGQAGRDTTLMGTNGYTAPEQYGFMETGVSADIYSIGKVMRAVLSNNENDSKSFAAFYISERCTEYLPKERLSLFKLRLLVNLLTDKPIIGARIKDLLGD